MNTLQKNLNDIMTTLQSLEIKAEFQTMNKLLGCLQLLGAIRDELGNWQPIPQEKSAEAKASEDLAETDPDAD